MTPQIESNIAINSFIIIKATRKNFSSMGGTDFQTKIDINLRIILSFSKNRAQNPVHTLGMKNNIVAAKVGMGPIMVR